jgi:hypothetical protein
MLFVYCVNGLTSWSILTSARGQVGLLCGQDNQLYRMADHPDATWPTAVGNAINHSAQLHGTVVSIFWLPGTL